MAFQSVKLSFYLYKFKDVRYKINKNDKANFRSLNKSLKCAKRSTCIPVLQTYFVKKNGDSTFKLAFSVTSAIESDNKLAYTTTTVLT